MKPFPYRSHKTRQQQANCACGRSRVTPTPKAPLPPLPPTTAYVNTKVKRASNVCKQKTIKYNAKLSLLLRTGTGHASSSRPTTRAVINPFSKAYPPPPRLPTAV